MAVLLLMIVMVTSAGCGFGAAPGAKSTAVSNDNAQAVAALNRIGVPLQRDPSGRVRWIEAVHGEMDDEAMRHLPGLPSLEWLEIGGGKVTRAGISHLKDCTGLRRLYVHDVKLAGDPLAWLSSLRRLEALSLQHTGISGAGLKHLNAAGNLRVLNLSGDDIGDEDLERVARMTGLEVLALQDTKVTGAGLAMLEGMSRLNVLNLTDCRIFDSDLEHFTSMRNLRIVFAAGCDIREQAIKNINARLPMLSIFQ